MLTIKANNIPDAWFQLLYNLQDYGRKYTIQKGSMEGETRLQYEFITVKVINPYMEPWEEMLPQIPAALSIPDPVTSEYLHDYVTYLVTPEKKEGEAYTYGERIAEQINHWVKVLIKTPETNQAILQVAQPSDMYLEDPPCLRHIGMNVVGKKLHFYPYFRSWDLWGGFPANMAGIAVLQKHMADLIGIEPGIMIAASNGLHVYGYAEELMRIRTHKVKGDW